MTTPEKSRGKVSETTARIKNQLSQLTDYDKRYLEMTKNFLAEAATDLIDANLFSNLDVLSNSGNEESPKPIKQPLFNILSRVVDEDKDHNVEYYLTPEGKILKYEKPKSGPKIPYIIGDFLLEAMDIDYRNLSRLTLLQVSSAIANASG
jgi:hypothetical protein